MPEYKSIFHRVGKYIIYLLAIYVLGWGFTSYQSVFLGLIFGTSLSLFNLWILVKKMDKFGKAMDTWKDNAFARIFYTSGNSYFCGNDCDEIS